MTFSQGMREQAKKWRAQAADLEIAGRARTSSGWAPKDIAAQKESACMLARAKQLRECAREVLAAAKMLRLANGKK